jgi:hypothetical protein
MRKKAKVRKATPEKPKATPAKRGEVESDEPGRKIDFGGIPERNLKKNLGC